LLVTDPREAALTGVGAGFLGRLAQPGAKLEDAVHDAAILSEAEHARATAKVVA
jgi:hypothetical protein